MSECLQLYRCEMCGSLIEVVLRGDGELVCCGHPMTLLEAKKIEYEGNEKHVPVIEIHEDGNTEVRVGSVPHPMEESHYIMFIEAISKDKNKLKRQYLYPQQEPKMLIKGEHADILAREYCNIHGLWESQND